MVVRLKKRKRKYFGTRSWGVGNIKNARGSGDRGGVGHNGRKHDFTYRVKYEKESLHKKGFHPWNRKEPKEIDLQRISKLVEKEAKENPTIELRGYKVLSNGTMAKPAVIKADAFSKKAVEKIKSVGGEAVKIKITAAA